MTGTASLFSVRALRDVQKARSDGRLPPSPGIYDVKALTEDNELTLALKHLEYMCASPKYCIVGTEGMPTVRRLFYQRLRWQRGALENLWAYGLTWRTLPYICAQVMIYISVAFVPFFLTVLTVEALKYGALPWSWPWFFAGVFVAFERIWSVRQGGWRTLNIALLVVPEILLDFFLHGVYIRSLTDSVTRARRQWSVDPNSPDNARPPARNYKSIIAGLLIVTLLLAVIGLAIACTRIGIGWALISIFVGVGTARAAIRLCGLDPMGLFLQSGELTKTELALIPVPATQATWPEKPDSIAA